MKGMNFSIMNENIHLNEQINYLNIECSKMSKYITNSQIHKKELSLEIDELKKKVFDLRQIVIEDK